MGYVTKRELPASTTLFIIDDAHIFIIDTVCHWSTCFVMLGANIDDSAMFAGLELELELVARVV